MDFQTVIEKRYSCRAFDSKPVEPEKTKAILEAARIAPTGCNYQSYHIWEFKSPEAIETLRSLTHFHFDAPNFLLVGVKPEGCWTRKYDNKNICDIDGAIICTHIMLKIEDLGLSTTWVGHFNAPELKKAIPELDGYELVGLFPYGYRAAGPEGDPHPRHFERKPLSELVSEL